MVAIFQRCFCQVAYQVVNPAWHRNNDFNLRFVFYQNPWDRKQKTVNLMLTCETLMSYNDSTSRLGEDQEGRVKSEICYDLWRNITI